MSGPARNRSQEPPTHAAGRLLLFVFWALVVWGTVYGLALLPGLVTQGPARLVRAVLHGGNRWAGSLNVLLAVLALCVWVLVALAVWRRRGERRKGEAGATDGTR